MSIIEKIKNILFPKKREGPIYIFPVIFEIDKILPEYGAYGYSIADQIIEQFTSLKAPIDGYFISGTIISNNPSHRILAINKTNHHLFCDIVFYQNESGKKAISNIHNIRAVIDGEYEKKSNKLNFKTINIQLK